MTEKKIIIFDGKQFYNAKHLYDYIMKNYASIHPVTYLQVREATGKRLKSINKFYKVMYEVVCASKKAKLKKWMQIKEGYEEIIAFEVRNFDDFIIKYLWLKDVAYLFIYKNSKKEIMFAFKKPQLLTLAEKYDPELAYKHVERVVNSSELKDNFYYYRIQPSQIKQNIF